MDERVIRIMVSYFLLPNHSRITHLYIEKYREFQGSCVKKNTRLSLISSVLVNFTFQKGGPTWA